MTAPIETYLRELATSEDLPDLAIRACVLRYEEASPILHALLARAIAGEDLSDDDALLLFRGLYVVAERRDREACRPLLSLLGRPDEELEWLLGDGLTQSMARIVASVFDGDADGLFAAIEDQERDEYARSSAFGAATFLTFDGRIERARMTQFLEHFHQQRLFDDLDFTWIDWAETIAMLGLTALAPLVEKEWSKNDILQDMVELKEFKEELAKAVDTPNDPEPLKIYGLGYIDDAVAALDWTRGSSEQDEDEGDALWEPDEDEDGRPWESSEDIPQPFHNPLRHVGRNDPCPCGSGKKAKRCCLTTG